MKGLVIFLLAAVVAGWLVWAKPWQEARYDDSKQGIEARKMDEIVDKAIAFPNIWEAREMLGSQPQVEGHHSLAFGSYDEFSKMVEDLYDAGATKVCFAYIVRRSRMGDQAEGMYAVLPKDPAKRKALFNLTQNWPHPPKDVNQKYLYYRIQGWDVDQPEKSFLGT